MKPNLILFCSLVLLLIFTSLLAFRSEKNSGKNKQADSEIRTSGQRVKTYRKEYDSLQKAYSHLEKEKQKVKTVYLQGKETLRYITRERIEQYTDTACREDVVKLKKHILDSDSLIFFQNKQIVNSQNRLAIVESILREKDGQIELYKNKKKRTKPLGIGITGGYGTDFQHGFSPFIGIGISYSLIRF